MVVEQEYTQGTWIGIGEIHVAENIAGLRGHLSGIGCQSMRNLQAILVGLVFDVPGEGVQDRAADGGDDR